MRHVYIRGFLAVVWLAAAIMSGGVLGIVMCCVFLHSAYAAWDKEKKEKGTQGK